MRLLTPLSVAAALLWGLVVTLPFVPDAQHGGGGAFAVTLTSSRPGFTQVYFDDGSGLSEPNSVRLTVGLTDQPQEYRFPLPARRFVALRFDPIDGPARVTLMDFRVVNARGRTVQRIAPADFQSPHQIAESTPGAGSLSFATTTDANDPQFWLRFSPPVDLRLTRLSRTIDYVSRVLLAAAPWIVVLFLGDRSQRGRMLAGRAAAWMREHPGRAVAALAALAAIVSSYPVVFFGRSLVSPNIAGPVLLYEQVPTLPGIAETAVEDGMGADVGAIAWHHHPLSILQHRALVRDGELPLWNRYDNGGSPLLGQGQSMFGDPLHLLAVAADGAAWAWDAKYVLARWLFGWALGWIVWRLTRHQAAAFVTACSAAFIGFFVYRFNHPAYFSMCYAPWILAAWVGLMQAPDRRARAGWFAGLVAACWSEMTSGTAKEAYMLLFGMNATGCLLALTTDAPWRERWATIRWAAGAGVVFVCLGAPVWLTFFDALRQAYTSYSNPTALQIMPGLVLGLFDELFYRAVHKGELVWNPSANFLVFGGVLFLAATWRRTAPDRARTALVLGALPAVLLAFGVIPPSWIIRVPFLGNVSHVDNTFSCVLIVHLIVLAGFGYRAAAQRLTSPQARGDILSAVLLGAAPVISWLAFTHTVHRQPYGPDSVKALLHWGQHLRVTDFVWLNLVALVVALCAVTLIWRHVLQRGRWTGATAILAMTCLAILWWRHGQHLSGRYDRYVVNPAVRVDFHAPSPAIATVATRMTEPARVVGLGHNLFPGWSGVYDLESISGPDAVVSGHYRELVDAIGLQRRWDWLMLVLPENLAREHAAYDFLNVRYYLDLLHRRGSVEPPLRHVYDGDLQVYESPTAWPRAFFTDRVARYSEPKELAPLVAAAAGRPFAAMQAAAAGTIPALPAALADRHVVPASDYRLTANTSAFTIVAPGPGLAVLHENWFAGDFRATLNGRAAEILRVNHAFKGVAIPAAGTYRVEFAYWPRRFTLALVLAALGLGGLVAVIVWSRRSVAAS